MNNPDRLEQRLADVAQFVHRTGHKPRRNAGRQEASLAAWVAQVTSGQILVPPLILARLETLAPARRTPCRPPDVRGFTAANAERTRTAATRVIAQAQAALPGCLPSETAVLRARIDHPGESLAELANRLGVTKHSYSARLRRALIRPLASRA